MMEITERIDCFNHPKAKRINGTSRVSLSAIAVMFLSQNLNVFVYISKEQPVSGPIVYIHYCLPRRIQACPTFFF